MKPQPNSNAKEPVNSEMKDYEHLLQYIILLKLRTQNVEDLYKSFVGLHPIY